MSDERNLTDADVKAIAIELRAQLASDFYGDLGRGIWGWAKKAIIIILLILAVQGMIGDKSVLSNVSVAR